MLDARWPTARATRTIATAVVAPPGFPQHAARGTGASDGDRRRPRRSTGLGSRRSDPRRVSQHRVRVGKSDRTPDDRQCPRRLLSGDCCAGCFPPEPSASPASTLQRFGRPDQATSGASVLAIRRAPRFPEDGYHGSYVEDLAKGLPDDVRAEADAATDPAAAADVVGRWAAGRVREGIEGEPRAPRRSLRLCGQSEAGSTMRDGWTARSRAPA